MRYIGRIAHEITFDDDEAACAVFEEYASSEASIDHFDNLGELAPGISRSSMQTVSSKACPSFIAR
jgi:hypothetical protein